MDVPDVNPFPAWVSCVTIPNMVQLRSSKMADGKALSSVSSDNEEPEQHQRGPIHYSLSKISIIPVKKTHYSRDMPLTLVIPKRISLFRYSQKIKPVIPLFQGKNFVIPLFPKNKARYSIIPGQKFSLFLFHYSSSAPESRNCRNRAGQLLLCQQATFKSF